MQDKKNSEKKRNYLVIAIVLLMANLLLVGFIFLNNYRTDQEIKQIKDFQDTEVLGATSIPIFDPSEIFSNSAFTSTRAFPTEQSVQDYLNRVNSPLRNYKDQGKAASYWIYGASRGITSSKYGVTPKINPGVIIAYLEKEQSLMSLSNYDVNTDPQNRIRTAMGYGCPDGTSCETKYYGLANQLNWATYQLQFNYDRAISKSSLVAPYHVNNTITTLDEYNVFISNGATAANYRYTPHVYWGNYNLWKIVTANGWGDSSRTYTYAEIDSVNLSRKDKDINSVDTGTPISLSEIYPILTTDYSYGSQSSDIQKLQRFLRQQGYYMNREITGMYGLITEQAQKNFRRDKGIVNSKPTEACKQLFERNWRIGQTGSDVEKLQICLREAGYFDWPVITGYYGPVTESGLNSIRKALATPDPLKEEGGNNSSNQPVPVASGTVVTTSKGVSESGLNLRDSACGQRVDTIPWNQIGQKLEGPIKKTCFGQTWNWYKVNFSGKIGWVVDYYLENTSLDNQKPNQNNSNSKEQPSTQSPKEPSEQSSSNNSSQSSDQKGVRIKLERVEDQTQTVKTNSKNENISEVPGLNLRDSACGQRVDTIPWNQIGQKLEGPIKKTCFGQTWNWYKVNFSGKIGWVVDYYLDGVALPNKETKTNSRGVNNVSGLNMRSAVCGNKIEVISWGQTGQKLEGPISAECFGKTWNWYKVNFNGQVGWVVDYYLD